MVRAVAFDFARRTLTEPDATEWSGGGAAAPEVYYWLEVGPDPDETDRRALAAFGLSEPLLDELWGADREGRFDLHEDGIHLGFSESVRDADGRLTFRHLDVFLGARALVTFHRSPSPLLDRVRRACPDDFLKYSRSPGFLLYELAESLLEVHRAALRELADAVAAVQDDFMRRGDEDLFADALRLHRDLLALHKVARGGRDVLHALATRRSPYIHETTQPFVLAVAQRLERLADDVALERGVLSDALNLYLGLVGHRTNGIMRVLTVVSSIFLPLTFLCGVYGMNFAHMPELSRAWAYPAFWGVAALLTGGMLLFFRRRRWL